MSYGVSSTVRIGKLLGGLRVLGRLGHLRLERGDLLVALGDLFLVVGGVAAYLRLALLLRLVLCALRGFLAANGLTVHVPSCLSSRKAGRDEQCSYLYRYGHLPNSLQIAFRMSVQNNLDKYID